MSVYPDLKRTPLHALHEELGAKFVPFAGYEMPVQYEAGVLKEHLHTRAAAGLFDVSHMGQLRLIRADAVERLERMVPGDIASLAQGAMRYTVFTSASGGILDDLMVTRRADHLLLVVNAGTKDDDIDLLRDSMGKEGIDYMETRALLALQGPAAAGVLVRHAPAVAGLAFMTGAEIAIGGIEAWVSRSGYTGEDGFEISVQDRFAEDLARLLLKEDEVAPIGLGARDSLRLEAGLCLYGSDLTNETTPVEAGLAWTISKRRRAEGGFPGDATVRRQIAEGPSRRRVGIRPSGRAPARAHTAILSPEGVALGEVTSGGFGPSVGGPIAMGYVSADHARAGTAVALEIRDKRHAANVVDMPFTPHRYVK